MTLSRSVSVNMYMNLTIQIHCMYYILFLDTHQKVIATNDKLLNTE